MSRIDVSIPSNPFHIARAYRLLQPARVEVTAPIPAAGKVEPIAAIRPRSQEPAAVNRMIAGTVAGGIDFSGSEPTAGSASLPLYRHPADKNAAATAVNAGRILDVQG